MITNTSNWGRQQNLIIQGKGVRAHWLPLTVWPWTKWLAHLFQGFNFLIYDMVLFPRWCSGKESSCQYKRCRRHGFDPWVKKIPWSRKWQQISVFLPGRFHGQRSLVGYSAWGCKELDVTEQQHTHRSYNNFIDFLGLFWGSNKNMNIQNRNW